MQKKNYSLLKLALITTCCVFSPRFVYANGFQLFTQNASALGNAYAGTSASALDASTNYYNPAGLVDFDTRQVLYATVFRRASVDFSGQTLWQFIPSPGTNSFLQKGTADSQEWDMLPSFSEVVPLNRRFSIGFSYVMPFDFESDYTASSLMRYASTDSSIYVGDITPAIGYRINDQWSIGGGVDIDHTSLAMKYMIGLPVTSLPHRDATSFDSESDNTASGWGVSGHGGILYQYSPNTRYGLSYHGPVDFGVSGESKLVGLLSKTPSGADLVSSSFRGDLKLPDYAELSVDHLIGVHWELLGSVDYTRWSLLNNVKFRHVLTPTNPITSTYVLPLNLHNAFRVAFGTNYFINTHFKLLTGIAYDQGAMKQNSAINYPDTNNLALAAGISYKLNRQFIFDLGYSHIFNLGSSNVNVTTISGFQRANVFGNVKRSEDMIGAQITWNLGYLGVIS